MIVVFAVGVLLAIAGFLLVFFHALRKGPLWALASLFPPAALVMVIGFWQQMRWGALTGMVGIALASLMWVAGVQPKLESTIADYGFEQEYRYLSDHAKTLTGFVLQVQPAPIDEDDDSSIVLSSAGGLQAPSVEIGTVKQVARKVFVPIDLDDAPDYFGRRVKMTLRTGIERIGILETVDRDRVTVRRRVQQGFVAYTADVSGIENIEAEVTQWMLVRD